MRPNRSQASQPLFFLITVDHRDGSLIENNHSDCKKAIKFLSYLSDKDIIGKREKYRFFRNEVKKDLTLW